MLIPTLPFEHRESPLSFAARLARFHSGTTLKPFLNDVGICPVRLASSEPGALALLAEISGSACEALLRNAPVRVGKRAYDLRGETVTAEFLSGPSTVFCPTCLYEDDQLGMRRGRWIWALSVVRTCPEHKVPLVHQRTTKWDSKLHELEHVVPERGEALKAAIAGATTRAVSPLQNYVLARLDGCSGPDWLDSQTLDQAVRATELLGVLTAFGPEQKLPELTRDDWDHAGRLGFSFTTRGEKGIREALDSQISKFDGATGTPGARKIFGCFYNALAYSKSLKEPGDIARIVREFIVERIALPAGEKVLGIELLDRRLHTVASLAREQGLDSRTLRDVLVAAKVVPENAAAHFPIPVRQGRGVAARVKRIVHVKSLPEVLNCTRPVIDQLFCERLLTPIYYGNPGIRGRTQKAVDREEIADLMAKLHAKALDVDQRGSGMVAISKAAEKVKVPAVAVIQLILGGYLANVHRNRGETGIGALLVSAEEVKRSVISLSEGLTPAEAFDALKLPRETGWELADRFPSEISLAPHVVLGPNEGHKIVRFLPKSVDDFNANFVTPARLAQQHDAQIGEVVLSLKKRGIRPVLTRAEVGVDFYRVESLPKDFLCSA